MNGFLEPGDEVVAAVTQRDCVLIFTRRGRVLRMQENRVTNLYQFERVI